MVHHCKANTDSKLLYNRLSNIVYPHTLENDQTTRSAITKKVREKGFTNCKCDETHLFSFERSQAAKATTAEKCFVKTGNLNLF